jgi:hypothetical protein
MEDFQAAFHYLCVVAVLFTLNSRLRAHTSRWGEMWFDKVTRRAYGEPPAVPPPPPRHRNLFVDAFLNLTWLSAAFILLTWATGLSLGDMQDGNHKPVVSGYALVIRIGFALLVLAVVPWAIRTLVKRLQPPSDVPYDRSST